MTSQNGHSVTDGTGDAESGRKAARKGLDVPAATYMPGRARSFRSTHTPALFMMVGVILLLLALSLWKLSRDVSRQPDKVNLGNRLFEVGGSERMAAKADQEPLLFADLVRGDGRSLDIRVSHLGADSWIAFSNVAAGADRSCQLRWDREASRFTDPCDGKTYPLDGAGLQRFLTRVDDRGLVVVDLNKPI